MPLDFAGVLECWNYMSFLRLELSFKIISYLFTWYLYVHDDWCNQTRVDLIRRDWIYVMGHDVMKRDMNWSDETRHELVWWDETWIDVMSRDNELTWWDETWIDVMRRDMNWGDETRHDFMWWGMNFLRRFTLYNLWKHTIRI